jgi:hypothetical protein
VGACWTSTPWWRVVLKGLLLAGLGANFLISTAGPGNAWFVPLEQLRNDQRWVTPWHRFLNDRCADAAVLAIGDAAVFDLKPKVYYSTCFDDCLFEQWVRGKTTQEIQLALASRQIGYVFVNWGEISRYRRTYGFTPFVQPEVFERLVEQGVLSPLPSKLGESAQVYRVLPIFPTHEK